MTVFALFQNTFNRILENQVAQLFGIILGVIIYLVNPSATFYALWISVMFDLISRLFAETKKHGGFIQAVKKRHIQSNKIFRGTAVKITAYFFMCVLANQSKYIFPYDAAALFSTIVYSILFLVEVWSMAENFQEAGVLELRWISRFSQKKLKELVDDKGEKEEKKNGGEGNS